MSEKAPRQSRGLIPFDGRVGPLSITRLDAALLGLVALFLLAVLLQTLLTVQGPSPYLILREQHYHFSRFTLLLAVALFLLALYIGLRRRGDVTPYFRRGVYVIAGTMLYQSLNGAAIYFLIGTRPGQDVHLIYGLGTLLALPFFIFVEKTAQKRPAMGSYMWGFALLAGIILRCIETGPPGAG